MPEDLISYYAQPAVWGTVWDFGGAPFPENESLSSGSDTQGPPAGDVYKSTAGTD